MSDASGLAGLNAYLQPEPAEPSSARCNADKHAFNAPDEGGVSTCVCGDYRITVERVRWRGDDATL